MRRYDNFVKWWVNCGSMNRLNQTREANKSGAAPRRGSGSTSNKEVNELRRGSNTPLKHISSKHSDVSSPVDSYHSNQANRQESNHSNHEKKEHTEKENKLSPHSSHSSSKNSLNKPDKSATCKSKIYDILENPETSQAAQIFSWVSMTLIVLSVGTFIAETMPKFKADLKKPWHETDTGLFFFLTETIFIAFFTVELLGRFLTCPNKKSFAKNALNVIDLISILPYYVELIVAAFDDGEGDKGNSSMSSLLVLRVLRLFRVLRIFKLSRHSNNMMAFGVALRGSLMELMSLGLFLAIDIVVFASILYYCEMKENGDDLGDNNFSSIPASCWWAVATITTVGYGDMYPRTWLGKVFGCFCVFSGILVIAFQVPIIVAKFTWTFMQNTNKTGEEEEEEESDSEEESEDEKPNK